MTAIHSPYTAFKPPYPFLLKLYTPKMVLTFNFKEGTSTITFNTMKKAAAIEDSGSNILLTFTIKQRPVKGLVFNL